MGSNCINSWSVLIVLLHKRILFELWYRALVFIQISVTVFISITGITARHICASTVSQVSTL